MTQSARIIAVFLATIAIVVISACNIELGSNVTASPTPPPPTASVTGSVAYPMTSTGREATGSDKTSLMPDLVLEVYLVSISRAGTSSTTIGKQVIKNPMSGSQLFTIEYLQEDIDENERYAIQGRLIYEDELIATNFTVYSVLTYGKPDRVNLILESVRQDSSDPSVTQRPGWSEVPAPVESVSVRETYTGYSIQVISYLPNGCFKFKGSEMKRGKGRLRDIWAIKPAELSANELLDAVAEAGFNPDINVSVTNLKSTLPVGCTVGVSFVKTEVPLRVRELISGKTYKIFVNGELMTTFTAR